MNFLYDFCNLLLSVIHYPSSSSQGRLLNFSCTLEKHEQIIKDSNLLRMNNLRFKQVQFSVNMTTLVYINLIVKNFIILY